MPYCGHGRHLRRRRADTEEQIAAYQREFWDLDPQVEKIVSALSRLNRRMNVAYGRQTAELGIKQHRLGGVEGARPLRCPYRLGPGDLASVSVSPPAAMTHRIDRMVGEGLVTRDRDESNRVRVIVELTAEGARSGWRRDAPRLRLRGGPAPGPLRDDRTALYGPHPPPAQGGSTPSRTRAAGSATSIKDLDRCP